MMMEPADPAQHTIHLAGNQLRARSFLLGNGAGLVLLAPVELNASDRSIVPHKWFGVSEYGRKYLEVNRVHVRFRSAPDQLHLLCRADQVSFEQTLTEAVRTFIVDGVTVRERFFIVRKAIPGVIISLESDRPATFILEPQFDMRYDQAFNGNSTPTRATVEDRPIRRASRFQPVAWSARG